MAGKIRPLEAALTILAIAVVIDDEVNDGESSMLAQQVELIASTMGEDTSKCGECVNQIIARIDEIWPSTRRKEGFEFLDPLLQHIEDRELKIALMNGIFAICYADDHFHAEEKRLVNYLAEHWRI